MPTFVGMTGEARAVGHSFRPLVSDVTLPGITPAEGRARPVVNRGEFSAIRAARLGHCPSTNYQCLGYQSADVAHAAATSCNKVAALR
jgi:hypothetical protein